MLKRLRNSDAEVVSLNLVDAFENPAKIVLTIGRDTISDFALHTRRCPLLISRYHAELRKTHHHLELKDLGSTNGTYVNTERLAPQERRKLQEGDLVSFGGGLKVRIATGVPDEDNPFVFRLKQLHRLFGGRPEPVSSLDAQHATQEAAPSTGRDDRCDLTVHIDLTASERSPFSVSIQNRPQPPRPAAVRETNARPALVSSPRSNALAREPEQPPFAKRRRMSRAGHIDLDANSSGDDVQILQETRPATPPPPPPLVSAGAPAQHQNTCIEEQFECQICRELMVGSHSLVPCGHMFCGECIGEWLQKKPSCPTCRANITAAPVPSLSVDNMLDSLAGSILDKDSFAERKARKEAWAAKGGRISNLRLTQPWGTAQQLLPPQYLPPQQWSAARDAIREAVRLAAQSEGIAVQVMARETASRGNVNRSQAVAQTVQGRLGHLDPSMVQFNYQRVRRRAPCAMCHGYILANMLTIQARYRDASRHTRADVCHATCMARVQPYRTMYQTREASAIPGAHLVTAQEWNLIHQQTTLG